MKRGVMDDQTKQLSDEEKAFLDEFVTAPNKILTKPCAPVSFPLQESERLDILDLTKRMIVHCTVRSGIGLSANQIGVSKQIFIMRMDGGWLTVVNPKIIKTGKDFEQVMEGCLSHPGVKIKKIRHQIITVQFFDFDGNMCERIFKRNTAYAVQHEMDHLSGFDFLTHSGV